MSPFPPVPSPATAHGIRYEIARHRAGEGHAERCTVDLSADGRARLRYEHGTIRRSWAARVEDVVWTRLLRAVQNGAPEDPSPAGPVHRRLQVLDAAAQPKTVIWGEGAASVEVGALLDSLVAQISGLPSDLVRNTLPPLAHRSVAGAASGLPVQEAAAVFGEVGDRPAFALARGEGGFGVFSVDPLKLLGETTEAGQPIRALALGSSGGRDLLVTGGDDNIVWAWDLTGNEGLVHARGGHGGAVRAVASRVDVDDDGLVYSGGEDGKVWAWGSRDGAEIGALTGHDRTVNALVTTRLAGLNLLVSGGDDGAVRVWNTDTGESLRTFTTGAGWVNAVAATGTGEGEGVWIAAAGSDHVVNVWDAATGTLTQTFHGHGAAVTGLAFLDLAGRPVLVSCSYDGTIRTWDVAAGRALDTWSAETDWPAALAAAPSAGGAVIVSGGATGTVRVWDPKGRALRTLTAEGGSVRALALAEFAGATTAAVGYLDGSLRIWDVATGSVRRVLDADDGALTSVAFGPAAGTVVCGTARGTVRVHSTADGALQSVPTPHTDGIRALVFLPVADGIVASAGEDRTVRTWEAATGRPLLRLRGHEAGVTRLAAGPVGAVTALASADRDARILIRDALCGRLLLELRAAGPLSALALGEADGVPVLTAAEAHGPVRVWNAVSGEELAALDTADAEVVALDVSVLDGTPVLLAGARDGKVRAWRLPDGAGMGAVALTQTPLALRHSPPDTLHVAGEGGLMSLRNFPS
ncbi:WD40 repeat domain-containing protein [Streptomyces sp. NPDC005955]|uniref:WD40 repeat domain-containing protein n=1 Tax=Streptomyces sp. NPDC005955 TaxID=3364738 RepID=UPI0036955FA1